jgi:hypothetical protein
MVKSFSQRFMIVASVLLGLPIIANAQDIFIGDGGADLTWRGTQPNAAAGLWLDQGAVSNGDTRRDLIVGSPGPPPVPGPAIPGAVYVIFGGPDRDGDLVLSAADTVITSSEAGNRFGYSTAVGHVLRDESTGGARNLVIGAPGASGNRGRVYVFTGGFSSGGPALTQANRVYEIVGAPGDQLGSALATGDIDNDGIREIIIGAPGNGRVYIIKGATTLSGTLDLSGGTVNPNKTIAVAGIGNVLTSGDVTGDGIYDVLVGVPSQNLAFLFPGTTGTILGAAPGSFTGVSAGDEAGTSLRILDIDGDGKSDLAIGAPGVDGPAGGRSNSGAVYVFLGPVTVGPLSVGAAQVVFFGAAANLRSGTALAAGDINRDAPNDIVILAPGGSSGSGELDIYYGRSRGSIGVAQPDFRRFVDFATAGQVSRRIFGDPALGPITSAQVFEVTGEGARDIIVGVAAAEAGAGKLFFTISPRLRITPTSFSLVVNEGGSVTSSVPVQVLNESTVVIGWQTSVTQPWLSTSPTAGSADETHPSQFYIVAASQGLSPGVHTGTVRVSSTSPDLELTREVSVTLTVTGARLAIDAPSEGATVNNGFSILGWAIDLAAPSGTGVSAVHAYAYPASGPPIFLGIATYGGARPDVGAFYGDRFTNSGYSRTVANLTPGVSYQISVFAKSTVTNSFANSASVNITVSSTSPPAGPTPSDPNPVPPPRPGSGGGGPTPGTGLSINRSSLSFGALAGTNATRTGAQSVTVDFATGSPAWTASANVAWLEVTPASGVGTGRFSVSVRPGTYSAGANMTGTVTVSAMGVSNSPVTLPVTLRVLGSAALPFGSVDTPANNATGIVGAIAVTGWALDDIAVRQVEIWRDPVSGETSGSANGKIFIGLAVPVEGARPDIDATFSLPFDYRAGWGYMLLTNMLPFEGNGRFVLQVYATDAEGRSVLLGSRAITCANATATKPFGSIDTPDQGGSVSGTNYTNFGWALTPQPSAIPTDGSTIMVFIDGLPVGRPTYNQFRPDIATLFPGRANSNGAVGFFHFNTTTLSNGVHTIAWSVTDNNGNAEGIGSRYFTVLNGALTSSLTIEGSSSVHTMMGLGADVREAARAGASAGNPASTLEAVPLTATPAYIRSGFGSAASLNLVETDARGVTQVSATEMDRFELTLGSPTAGEEDGYEGYLVSNGRLEALPAGAFLDRKLGQFFWQPGAGFVGTYNLVFVRVSGGARERIPVEVRISPRKFEEPEQARRDK